RGALLADWVRFLAGAIRHPRTLFRALRFRREHPQLWPLLVEAARRRTAEDVTRRGGEIPPAGLARKELT
ncbi:MAG: hypothetical protein JWM35_913, partial [Verrucomicrobia bacterium]|nr:hypothetical protein [Verrucomicrobiota bacterium]